MCDQVNGEDEGSEDEMSGAIPLYSRKRVDAAGATLIATDRLIMMNELDSALNIINNWRSCHSVPLNIVRRTLRINSIKIDRSALVSQRIKRLSSIAAKLQLHSDMKLCQMQDIGGCRAVLKNVQIVTDLANFYEKSQTQNELMKVDDYISKPKLSGYRGIHLIYRYWSEKNTKHNKLKIEIQLRSKLQHAWATAVETAGTFVKQALKSSQGEDDWLRFFALMGTAIALREKCNLVPETPQNKEKLIREIQYYKNKLKVDSALNAFGTAIQVLTDPSASLNAKYYLLHLDSVQRSVSITGFQSKALDQASEAYLQLERKISQKSPGSNAVLVSVDSLQSLQKAYPNYFLDSKLFIDAVNKAIA